MPLREKYNIKSNCVTLDDSFYDETDYQQDIEAMDEKEKEIVRDVFSNSMKAVYKTGEAFVNELRQKIRI